MARWGSGRRVWLVATAIAVMTVAGLIALFRAPERPAVVAQVEPAPVVTLVRDPDALLTEEAAMRDPTPLFLPTGFNAAEDAFTAGTRRELSSSFHGFEPKLKYPETGLTLGWPQVIELPERPADAFETDKPRRPFLGFGQTGVRAAPLSSRTAFVEVVAAANGELMIARPLMDATPPAEASWQPLQFLVAVDASGVVGPPVLTESSRVAAVDRYFEEYLLNVLHVGERLAPGFYRVGIGP